MLPELILNWTALISFVLLKYPAIWSDIHWSLCVVVLTLTIKCLTNVVEDGLYKVNVPEPDWSLSLPICWRIICAAVDCAKSCEALYSKPLSLPASLWVALKNVVVFTTL